MHYHIIDCTQSTTFLKFKWGTIDCIKICKGTDYCRFDYSFNGFDAGFNCGLTVVFALSFSRMKFAGD